MPQSLPPTQLTLQFAEPRNRPPLAPATPELLETLAELLLAAMGDQSEAEASDESEDQQ